MSLLVTGAAGFLGSAVVRALVARFPGEAVIAADLDAPSATIQGVWQAQAEISPRRLDVTDATAVSALLASTRPRILVHAAAMTPTPDVEAVAAPRVVAVNVAGSAAVLQAAADSGVARVILVSSQAVYGTSPTLPDPVTEATPPAPETLYGITKLAAEAVAQRIAAVHAVSCVSVRVAALYGLSEAATPSRPRPSEIARLLAALREGRAIATATSDAARDWTDVEDAADAIAALAAAPTLRHATFNVSTGEALPWTEVLAVFARHGLRVVAPWTPAAIEIPPPLPRRRLDVARLAADAGFRATRRLDALLVRGRAA